MKLKNIIAIAIAVAVLLSVTVIAIHAVGSDNIELPESDTTTAEVTEAPETESEMTETVAAESDETELTTVTETDVDFYRGLISAEKVEKMNAFAKANAISLDYTPKFEQNGMVILAPGISAAVDHTGYYALGITHSSKGTYRLVFPDEPNSVPTEEIDGHPSSFNYLYGEWTLTYRGDFYSGSAFLLDYIKENFSKAEYEEWQDIRSHLRYSPIEVSEPVELTTIKYFEITKEQYEEARLNWIEHQKESGVIDDPYYRYWYNSDSYELTFSDTGVDILYTFDVDLMKEYFLRDQEGVAFEYDEDKYLNGCKEDFDANIVNKYLTGYEK